MGYNPAIDRDYASQPATGAIRLLERNRSTRFVSMEPVPQNAIPLGFGLYEARGYDFPILRRYDHFWRRELSPESPSLAKGLVDVALSLRNITPQTLRALRLLGVTHLMQPNTLPPLTLEGVRAWFMTGRMLGFIGCRGCCRGRSWLGRSVLWVVATRLCGGYGAGFRCAWVGLTERRVAGLPEVGAGRAGVVGGAARIARYEPERVVVRARSAGGFVGVGRQLFPGLEGGG